jgi:RNA polymerase sigma factor (sigma-70 family)
MRATDRSDAALVGAAQAGDRQAVDELVATYLPIVYNLVGRALGGHPDVDDIVQETMLRAVRDLPTVRAPESFRAWLLTIAVRQVLNHRQRRHTAAGRTAALDDAIDVADTGADFEGLAILRHGLSGQRRQAVRAGRWLDPDARALLSLWWLEVAGRLTRTELAAAMGLTAAHAGVRVQRMHNQLELCRSVVAALEAVPGCAELDAVVATWDRRPGPLWRKRIARHVRSCARCTRAADGLVPPERLLIGLALLPVPATLTAALTGTTAPPGAAATTAALPAALPGVKAGLLGQLVHAISVHPLVATAVAGALVLGVAASAVRPSPAPAEVAGAVAAQPAAPAAGAPPVAGQSPGAVGPSAGAITVPYGPVSLESANESGYFVAVAGDVGVLVPIDSNSSQATRQGASFEVVPGLAGNGCVSFRGSDDRYLRHSNWRLRLDRAEGTVLFRGDATFCARPGATPGSVMWESHNYPGMFLRHVGAELWVDRSDASAAFRADSSFRIRPPLAG